MTRVKQEVFVKIYPHNANGLGVYERNGLDIFDWGTTRCISNDGGNNFLIALCDTTSDAKQAIKKFRSRFDFELVLKDSSFKIVSRKFNLI